MTFPDVQRELLARGFKPYTGPATCPHEDVRYSATEHGAIACYVCGRLFGHLRPNGYFEAFNP